MPTSDWCPLRPPGLHIHLYSHIILGPFPLCISAMIYRSGKVGSTHCLNIPAKSIRPAAFMLAITLANCPRLQPRPNPILPTERMRSRSSQLSLQPVQCAPTCCAASALARFTNHLFSDNSITKLVWRRPYLH